MRHKKRTKYLTNITFTHNLLHSDKSTYSNAYFYNNKHVCRLSKRFLNTSIPLLGSAIALLVVVGALVCPIVGSGSDNNILGSLLNGLAGTESVYAAEATAANPDFSISLNLGSNIQSEQPLDHGVVGYIENTFTVSSKSAESYSVYLQPAEGSTSNLVGSTYKQEIPGVGTNITVDNFTNNTWGYGISNTNNTTIANNELTYSTIPNGSTPIKTVSKPDEGDDTYKLVFAARIGDDKPVDHYQSQVLLSVTASAKETASLGDITYMQEVTPEVCSSTPEADASGNNQYQLIDKRDNKKYWVAKLKDGNCWMTQNLDLDLNGRTLTTTDSDVTTNWTSTTGASALWSTKGNNDIKYYDPGDKYCPSGNCGSTTNTSSNNGHDHQGNYYSFNAATAGTGQSVTSTGQNASSSICPKGWQLPISGNKDDKSFGKLTADYGIVDDATGSTALRAAPLYFIYGGAVYSGSLSAGSNGFYWSSAAWTASQAYGLSLLPSNVFPSGVSDRYYGRSIRCVVR